MAQAGDLVNHYHIPTEITSAGTIHTSTVHNLDRRERRIEIKHTWTRERRIGSGGSGVVFLEKEESEGQAQLRAVKRVQKSMHERSDREGLRELLSLAIVSKDEVNFPTFYGWFDDTEYIYIAMEYFKLGDLHQCLTNHGKPLSEFETRVICLHLTEALEVIHKHSITHRDLRPNNVFVISTAPNWSVKLGDFGISKRVQNNDTSLYTMLAGPYVAPEVIGLIDFTEETVYTSAVDIWSLGCVAYWLLTLQVLFQRLPIPRYCQSGKLPEEELRSRSVSIEAIKFIRSCLHLDPRVRPCATAAADSQWFQTKDVEEVEECRTLVNSESPTIDEVDDLHINNFVAGRILIAHKNYITPDPDWPLQNRIQRVILEGEWIELRSECRNGYLLGSYYQGTEVCFPNSIVYLPIPWQWCDRANNTGLFIDYVAENLNLFILVKSTNGEICRHYWDALSTADRRLVSHWKQASITLPGNVRHPYLGSLSTMADRTTWKVAEHTLIENVAFKSLQRGLIFLTGDYSCLGDAWPVEYVAWKDLLRLKTYFNRLPEKILQQFLFPSYLSDDLRKCSEFGRLCPTTAAENVSSFLRGSTLQGFSMDIVWTDIMSHIFSDLKYRDMAFIGAAIDDLIVRVKSFQEGPLFKESLVGQRIEWEEWECLLTDTRVKREAHIISIYRNHILVRREGNVRMEKRSALSSPFIKAVREQADFAKFQNQKVFPLWDPFPDVLAAWEECT